MCNTVYSRGWRMGAIRVRREAAEEARRQACEAYNANDYDASLHLHTVADRHEAQIDRYAEEIQRLGGSVPLPLLRPVTSTRRQ